MKIKSCFNKIIPIVITTLVSIVPVVANAVNTHIQTDGSLSGISELNINAPGSHQIHTLSELNGKLSGQNLFYSFSNFNIAATDTAWFNLNTPSLANVISRVTGGTESLISGNLALTNPGSAPAFYFINPSGIFFGTGASVDVPGSFFVSTASGLNFSNGDQFPAIATSGSSLSSATPESFGFLGNEAGIINIGSSDTDPTVLAFKPGTDVAFAANHIVIDNSVVTNADTSQDGIQLQITATGSESANIKPDDFVDSDQLTAGEMIIYNSHIEASGNGSGYLGIQTGNFTGINSELFADNTGDKPMSAAHGTDIYVKSDLISDNTDITNDALGAGNAGLLNVHAAQIVIQNKAEISSNTYGEGAAGSVTVKADQITLAKDGRISSSTFSGGDANEVFVNAKEISIDGSDQTEFTGIVSNAVYTFDEQGKLILKTGDSSGSAGFVGITAETVNLANGGSISSFTLNETYSSELNLGSYVNVVANKVNLTNGAYISTQTFGEGNAGGLAVQANEINVDGNSIIDSDTVGSGHAGEVLIIGKENNNFSEKIYSSAKSLTLTNGSIISSSTIGSGDAGDVTVMAEQIKIDGAGSSFFTGIASDTASVGFAGSVTAVANSIELLNGGLISTSTLGSGGAGLVSVQAGDLKIDGAGNSFFTGIRSDTESAGSAGFVTVVANSIELLNGGLISTSTLGSGDAGFVSVQAGDLKIDGAGSSSFTGIASVADGGDKGGIAGSILIMGQENNKIITNVDSIKLRNGGTIATSSSGNSAAGDISIYFQEISLDSEARIESKAQNGQGGNILLSGGKLAYLNNSIISTSAINGKGGNINVDGVDYLILQGGFIQSNTEGSGKAGMIDIDNSTTIIASNETLITSNKKIIDFDTGRNGGTINVIQTAAPNGLIGNTSFSLPQLNLNAMMVNLPIEKFDSRVLNQDMCAIEEGSSLVFSGKGGLRSRAGDFLH